MPPKKIQELRRKFGTVETIHITRKLPIKKTITKAEPTYGAFAIIKTRENEFVFQRQSYEQLNVTKDDWMVPGGKLEGEESFEEAALREVREETGMGIKITGIYKIFHHINHYEGGTEEWYLAVFFADIVSESPNHSSPEVLEIRRFREFPEHFMGELGKYYRDLK